MSAAGELGEMNERRKGIMKETKRSRFGVGFCRFSSLFESVLAAEFGRIHWPGRGLRKFQGGEIAGKLFLAPAVALTITHTD